MQLTNAYPRIELRLQTVVGVARHAVRAFSHRNTSRIAAALAYYTLFSLFPILLLLLSLLGFLLDAGWSVAVAAQQDLLTAVEDFLPSAGDWVSNAIQSIQEGRSASGIIGLLGLLWSASSTFNHLHIVLDQIWGLPGRADLRLTVQRRVGSLLIVLGLGLLLLVAQAVRSVTYWLTSISDHLPGGALLQAVVTWLFPFFLASVVFALMYRFLPTRKISWQEVWPGAVLAGVGWEALKLSFALYASNFANWQAVYGPVASVIGLLTWLYLSYVVVLFGAEFAAAYAEHLRRSEAEAVVDVEEPTPELAGNEVVVVIQPAGPDDEFAAGVDESETQSETEAGDSGLRKRKWAGLRVGGGAHCGRYPGWLVGRHCDAGRGGWIATTRTAGQFFRDRIR